MCENSALASFIYSIISQSGLPMDQLERERQRQAAISRIKEQESTDAIDRAQRLVAEARAKREKDAENANRLAQELLVTKNNRSSTANKASNRVSASPTKSSNNSVNTSATNNAMTGSLNLKTSADANAIEQANRAEALARLEMLRMAKEKAKSGEALPPPPPIAQRPVSASVSKNANNAKRKSGVTNNNSTTNSTTSGSAGTGVSAVDTSSKVIVSETRPSPVKKIAQSATKSQTSTSSTPPPIPQATPTPASAAVESSKPIGKATTTKQQQQDGGKTAAAASTVANSKENLDTATTPPTVDQVPSDLPLGWSVHVDKSTGDTFYYNQATGQSVWDKPTADMQPVAAPTTAATSPARPLSIKITTATASQDKPLPAGWTKHVDKSSGDNFYYNTVTGESVWDMPIEAAVAPAPEMPKPQEQPQQQEQQQSVKAESQTPSPVLIRTTTVGSTDMDDNNDDARSDVSTSSNSNINNNANNNNGSSSSSTIAVDDSLPVGWIILTDASTGYPYYWNVLTNKTKWDKPEPETAVGVGAVGADAITSPTSPASPASPSSPYSKTELDEYVNTNLQSLLQEQFPQLYRTSSEIAFGKLLHSEDHANGNGSNKYKGNVLLEYYTIILQSFNSAFLTAFVMMRDVFQLQFNAPIAMTVAGAVASSVPFAAGWVHV
jgi:hypothetical protein